MFERRSDRRGIEVTRRFVSRRLGEQLIARVLPTILAENGLAE